MFESDYDLILSWKLVVLCDAEYCIINYIILYDVRVYINCMLKVGLCALTVDNTIIIYLNCTIYMLWHLFTVSNFKMKNKST